MPRANFEAQLSALLSAFTESSERAPSSLKARIYSALIRKQQETGPLASLEQLVSAGHDVCVFEKLVQIAPVSNNAKSPFFCEVCHARVLAEHFDHAPIFWAGCPYVKFKES
jgi:hypothetical protein